MSVKLETDRLIIIPLTNSQLQKFIVDDDSLAKELNLTHHPRAVSEELLEAFNTTIFPKVSDSSKNYLFSTLWTIILKEENTMVGNILFKGEPNEEGEIEIGYGLQTAFRNRGIMAGAVRSIIQWAFAQTGVTTIQAETDRDNFKSQEVLRKNNFQVYVTTDKMLWWKLEKAKTMAK